MPWKMRLNTAGCADHLTLVSKIWLMTFQTQLAFKSSSFLGFNMRYCIKNSMKINAKCILDQKENTSGK